MSGEWRRYLIGGVLLLVVVTFYPSILVVEEKTLYRLFPSQERAVRYGDRHFNASDSRLYDLDVAESFYKKAEQFKTSHLHLQHQLARIAFLRGNLNTALFYINRQIELHGEELPNSYYMRGLIKGYAGQYDSAAKDYEVFLRHYPNNWAAITDYAWVLTKGERYREAANALEKGLAFFPNSPWLLNSSAIALFELGEYPLALERAKKAVVEAAKVTEKEWLTAYPGNDPRTAPAGIQTLQKSAEQNMHMIQAAIASSTVQ